MPFWSKVTILRSLRQAISREINQALIRAFFARSIAAFGAILLTITIGRIFGPSGVGTFALAYSFLMGGGVISRAGMDNALMRYVGQDHGEPETVKYLGWATAICLVISLVIGVSFWFGSASIENAFNSPSLGVIIKSMAVALPPFAFGFLLSGFFKGLRKPATACLLENGAVALISVFSILLLNFFQDDIGLVIVGYSYALAAWLVAIIGLCRLWFWKRAQIQSFQRYSNDSSSLVSISRFMATSRAFFVTGFAGYSQAILGVIVAGWFLSSSDLGVFRSSQQAALLIGFVLIVINSVFPPRFASLYHNGKLTELSEMARKGSAIGMIVAGPLTLFCLIAPEIVLGLFGDGFNDGEMLLRIMVVAQFFNVATGSVCFLLNMTGNETLMRNIAIVCNVIGLLSLFTLVPLFGPLGAAVSVAFILFAQNAIALLFVWKRLGIWMLPSLKFSNRFLRSRGL